MTEALDWGAFDAVVITTPTFTHRDFAVAAANAGKHVFLEKPMALTLAECDAIIEAAKKRGRRAADRFHAPIRSGLPACL